MEYTSILEIYINESLNEKNRVAQGGREGEIIATPLVSGHIRGWVHFVE